MEAILSLSILEALRVAVVFLILGVGLGLGFFMIVILIGSALGAMEKPEKPVKFKAGNN